MVTKIRALLFRLGGYAFWWLLGLGLVFALIAKGCASLCSHEVVDEVRSPNGKFVAEVSIGDCGGATTNFFGSVIIKDVERGTESRRVFGFEGRPSNLGLVVQWQSDELLVLRFDDLQQVRIIDPTNRGSGDFHIRYDYTGKPPH
ncbi:hypothetical protein Fbal_2651 [Ferrimonas balearica DSM 9799]|uniref:Uncharacterized protein n=1 Tax=Ferrimonas balearica (strain DSM 9799 / CCM 4581 / KCTC 23876 / PAT) TaxID=550540 RepID=E1SQ81_FERBD|nr:hypothetical protein [Ferrimonas balearica]ADN76853.1 hypothetical protein Fbal_2651 [Ferrimonas balearica DSM 9799]